MADQSSALPPDAKPVSDTQAIPKPRRGAFFGGLLRATPGWLVSLAVHAVLLLTLAVIHWQVVGDNGEVQLVVRSGDSEEVEEFEDELEEFEFEEVQIEASGDVEFAAFEAPVSPALAMEFNPSEVGLYSGDDLLVIDNALGGRGLGMQQRLLEGASEESEMAVAKALEWLAAHQMRDGSWCFNHRLAPGCGRRCDDAGSLKAVRNGATAIALLPFLGAGQTHTRGNYQEEVQAGLYFLINRMKTSDSGGSFHEHGGRMYSHGLASIVLCEAYAMTQDKSLREPAQLAIDFICHAQDPVGGGWRYEPHESGDTSVVGWQIMALKSGHMGYLRVPPDTVQNAYKFLDSVEIDGGAAYGYLNPDRETDASTAVGLLCRMYMGWDRYEPALVRGVEALSSQGPSNNAYHNYYATQVMRHWEGELWEKWNNVMRDKLVDSQGAEGHETGSWAPGEGTGMYRGGRLYETAMSTMILEVYYRHLPIYRKQTVEESFVVD